MEHAKDQRPAVRQDIVGQKVGPPRHSEYPERRRSELRPFRRDLRVLSDPARRRQDCVAQAPGRIGILAPEPRDRVPQLIPRRRREPGRPCQDTVRRAASASRAAASSASSTAMTSSRLT